MKNVYEIRYEALCRSTGNKRGAWSKNNEPIHVLANGTALGAIKKATSHLLGKKSNWVDGDGTRRTERTLMVKITSVERVLTLDA